MDVEFVDVEKNVGEKHPKLKGKEFPIIDREKQTVTVYSRRLGALVTFKVPEARFRFPPIPGSPARGADSFPQG